ncbi:MAG TPA: MiaB/RimO family radical SAM methylthiotransferase [Oligoflexia bacterium]|nr:MiaB/RimO family radical SAM methylthiotransferase [Oligoflexia bacterium]
MQSAVTNHFRFSLKTLGCKANVYDSLVLERELMELGGVRDELDPQVFLVNSCTVTAEADKQSRRELILARRQHPNTVTIMTGCSAEVANSNEKTSYVDHLVPNHAKSKLRTIVAHSLGLELPVAASEQTSEVYWGQLPEFAGRTRAFLKVQEGCNDFCTYCIIPYARGKSRSVPLEQVLTEINRLQVQGVREVVITGTNIADWGKEFSSSIEDLVDEILRRTAIPRIRLSSLDPSEISERLLTLLANEPRLMPHVHLSLQSPVSRVLRAMKRDYRSENVVQALEAIARAGDSRGEPIFVGMDIIAGFPSESVEEHCEGLELLKSLPWMRMHVFPYSEREGTPALKIPGSVAPADRKARAAELMVLSDRRHEQFARSAIGHTTSQVLIETTHRGSELESNFNYVVGHAPNYSRVLARVASNDNIEKFRNQFISVSIEDVIPKPHRDWTLTGTAIL